MLGIDGMREWGPRQQWRVAGSRQLALCSAPSFHEAVRPVHLWDPHPTDLPLSFFYFLFFYFFWSIIPYKTHTHTHIVTTDVDNVTLKFTIFGGPHPDWGSSYLIHSCMLMLNPKKKKKKVKKKHKKWTISYTRPNSVIRAWCNIYGPHPNYDRTSPLPHALVKNKIRSWEQAT